MADDIFAPPSEQELQSLNSSNSKDLFAPPSEQELHESGQLEALGRGAAQGLSFGFGDELAGAGSSAIQSLLETLGVREDNKQNLEQQYEAARDLEREANKAAEEAHPGLYAAGDIGTGIGVGLLSGGAGLLGSGLKTGIKAGGKEALKAMAKIGAMEGAAQGLGRSEADLTEGEFGEAALDTGIGAGIGYLAPHAIDKVVAPVAKGTGQLAKWGVSKADDVLESVPIAGDVYSHLKDVAKEGTENLGTSFKGAAQKALKKLSGSAKEIKDEALEQEQKYMADLAAGKASSNKAAFGASKNFQENLGNQLNSIGKDLERQDILINEQIQKLPGHLSLSPEGLQYGKFNFSHLDPEFEKLSQTLEKTQGLKYIQDNLKKGDYLDVAERIRDLDRVMQNASPGDYGLLKNLKKQIQQTVDQNLKNLPGDAGQLYGKRMDIAKDYSLLADVRDNLVSGKMDPTSGLERKFSFMANKESPEGLGFMEELRKAYQSGSDPLIESADTALQKAEEFNKFNVFNPEKGKMFNDLESGMVGPLTAPAQNEAMAHQFSNVFGKPKEFGMSANFANTLENLSDDSTSITPEVKKEQLIDWLKAKFKDKAPQIIKELEEEAKKFKTLESGLEKNAYAGQDVSSWIRVLKKAADPMAFGTGKIYQKGANFINSTTQGAIEKGVNQATALRSMTQPRLYKETVQQFKESQKNGGAPYPEETD